MIFTLNGRGHGRHWKLDILNEWKMDSEHWLLKWMNGRGKTNEDQLAIEMNELTSGESMKYWCNERLKLKDDEKNERDWIGHIVALTSFSFCPSHAQELYWLLLSLEPALDWSQLTAERSFAIKRTSVWIKRQWNIHSPQRKRTTKLYSLFPNFGFKNFFRWKKLPKHAINNRFKLHSRRDRERNPTKSETSFKMRIPLNGKIVL